MLVNLKTLVVLAAALGAASAKKKTCTTKTPAPTSAPVPSSTPAPPPPPPTSVPPTSTAPAPPSGTPEPTPPSGGTSGGGSGGGQYSMTDNFVGQNWYDGWDFWNNPDPTHGMVTYVDKDTAVANNLSFASDNSFVMRADSTTTLSPGQPRNSIRIQSKKQYTAHTAVIDINHMPQGPGTWPAYWTCGDNWPNGGEFDIVEGVNDGDSNLSSLHTSPGCTQPQDGRAMSGSPTHLQCDATQDGNQGCGVAGPSGSYGPNFNQNGGGWFATERTDNTIKVWYWGRNDPNVPSDVKTETGGVSPDSWGTPTVLFVSDECDINSKFGPNNFIINLTLCGDWAGNAFNGGMDACNNAVADPSQYTGAYWDIARMTVYI